MQDVLKIVKLLEDSGILLNGITETLKNEVKEQKGGFISMLLGALGALLGDLLTKNLSSRGVIRAGEGTIRAPHPLTNFEIQTYYQDESRFIGVYSRDNLPDKKGWRICN